MILLAVACLIFVSCDNKKATVPVEEPKCELAINLDKWATFGDLDEEGQIALVAEMKAFIDETCKEKCKEAEEGGEAPEPCPEKEAFKAKWETFETLTLEEQKEIIDQVFVHMKACCKKEAECVEEVPAE